MVRGKSTVTRTRRRFVESNLVLAFFEPRQCRFRHRECRCAAQLQVIRPTACTASQGGDRWRTPDTGFRILTMELEFRDETLALDLLTHSSARCGVPRRSLIAGKEVHMSWSTAARKSNRRNGERFETDLTDVEWTVIEPRRPPTSRMGRRLGVNWRPAGLRYVGRDGRHRVEKKRKTLKTNCDWSSNARRRDVVARQGSGFEPSIDPFLRERCRRRRKRRGKPSHG